MAFNDGITSNEVIRFTNIIKSKSYPVLYLCY